MKNKRITSFILFTGATIVLFLSGTTIDFPKAIGGSIAAIGLALLSLSLGVILFARMKARRSRRSL